MGSISLFQPKVWLLYSMKPINGPTDLPVEKHSHMPLHIYLVCIYIGPHFKLRMYMLH